MQPKLQILFSAEQIAERVQELGRAITNDYNDKDLVCVGVLEDSFVFMADLVRAIQRPVACYFIKAITGEGMEEGARFKRIFFTPVTNLKNRHVLLLVGIIDTGVTADFVARNLLLQEPSSLKIVTLVDKPDMRRSAVTAGYVAFTLRDEFVVGYGLGSGDQYGNFPSIGVVQDRARGV